MKTPLVPLTLTGGCRWGTRHRPVVRGGPLGPGFSDIGVYWDPTGS